MPTSGTALLSPDLPLEDPADDRLGYVRFSQLISNAIASMVPVDGLVVGLHGPRGAGRTSVGNFVRRLLEDVPHTVVSEFNPWRYAAGDDIARRYLETLIPVLAPGVEAGDDPAATRVAAAEVLRRERTRHVVVIDDLDRVEPSRAAEIGRLVSAVTDLPNVVHLLVLERTTLAETDLERVVQVPFDLPLPEGLQQMLFDDLRALMAANPHASGVSRRALGHDLLARHREPDRDAPGRDPAHERAAADLPAGVPRAEPRRLHRRRGGAGLPARPLRHDPPSPGVLRRRASRRRRGGIRGGRQPRVPRLLGGRRFRTACGMRPRPSSCGCSRRCRTSPGASSAAT